MRMKNALEWSSSCMYVLADGSTACMHGSNDPCACMHGSSNDGVLSMHVRVLAKGELACGARGRGGRRCQPAGVEQQAREAGRPTRGAGRPRTDNVCGRADGIGRCDAKEKKTGLAAAPFWTLF